MVEAIKDRYIIYCDSVVCDEDLNSKGIKIPTWSILNHANFTVVLKILL
jgi:hypothetical protein